MRCVIQRVSSACVVVDGHEHGRIGLGLLVLAGLFDTDTRADCAWSAEKISGLRIFDDGAGKMNLSVHDLCGGGTGVPPVEGAKSVGLLIIPNFTLAGEATKGRRPSFDRAMRPEQAQPLFEEFVGMVRRHVAGTQVHVATGVFRAHMDVTLTNDGPVTIVIESPTPV